MFAIQVDASSATVAANAKHDTCLNTRHPACIQGQAAAPAPALHVASCVVSAHYSSAAEEKQDRGRHNTMVTCWSLKQCSNANYTRSPVPLPEPSSLTLDLDETVAGHTCRCSCRAMCLCLADSTGICTQMQALSVPQHVHNTLPMLLLQMHASSAFLAAEQFNGRGAQSLRAAGPPAYSRVLTHALKTGRVYGPHTHTCIVQALPIELSDSKPCTTTSLQAVQSCHVALYCPTTTTRKECPTTTPRNLH